MAITNMSIEQQDRTCQQWSELAGEPVAVELRGTTLYGFTSELGAYKLFHAFRRCMPFVKVEYSSNLDSWYFAKETDERCTPMDS
jgi:hypothetical protein